MRRPRQRILMVGAIVTLSVVFRLPLSAEEDCFAECSGGLTSFNDRAPRWGEAAPDIPVVLLDPATERPVYDPQTLVARLELVHRFADGIGDQIPFLVDDLSNSMMEAYDAYPFRVFAITPDGTITVPSDKGASGFEPTLNRIEAWLSEASRGTG